MKAPCKDCKDRKVTDDYNCHTHCEKYLAYQAYRKLVYEENIKRYALEPKRRRYRT